MPVALVKEPFFLGSRFFQKGRAELLESDLDHPLVVARCHVYEAAPVPSDALKSEPENEPDKRRGRGRRPHSDDNGLSDILSGV